MVQCDFCTYCAGKLEQGDSTCYSCGRALPSVEVGLIKGSQSKANENGIVFDLIRTNRREGTFGEIIRGVGSIIRERNNVDFNDYKPCQSFRFNNRPLGINTVGHELGKNVIGIRFESYVALFQFEQKKDPTEEYFTLCKMQEFHEELGSSIPNVHVTNVVSSFSICPSTTISRFGDSLLSYAVSWEGKNSIYFVTEISKGQFINKKTIHSQGVVALNGHKAAVRNLAFDAERGELLSSLSDDCECLVWSVGTCTPIARFNLQSPGVACLWHRSDPYKLLIIEKCGLIRMCNTLKQREVITIDSLIQTIYSADWCPNDGQYIIVGANKAVYIFDLTRLNSEPAKRVDTHFGPTHFVKFNSLDSQQYATGTMSANPEIKTFQRNFRTYIWTQKQENIQDISWVFGQPFLLTLSGKELLIYESALV